MRAVTIATAGAAFVGTVAAGSHVENMHKQLHARSGWSDWSSDPVAESTSRPVRIASTTSSNPVRITSTSSDPAESHTWEDWSTSSSSVPVRIASTTSSNPVRITSTSSDPAESHTWEDWSTTTSSAPVRITSTSSDPADPHTWADWESSSSPVKITSTSSDPDHTWADWETSTIVKSGTTTTTIYLGKPTDPVSVPADLASTSVTHTWEDWSTTTAAATTPAVVVSTSTSSSVAPVWSSNGWFGPGWGADGQCAIQVITSYGSPIWAATPEAALPVLSVTVSPTGTIVDPATYTWADWSSTSSDPAVVTRTSTSSTEHWDDWTSTSSVPAVVTSTSSTEHWDDWSSTSSDPAVVTRTSTSSTEHWDDWTSTSSVPAVVTSTSSTETWADWSSTSSVPAVVTSTSSTETWADWAPAPTGGLANSGSTWGMTYSPFTSQGGCKDASTVSADLAILASKGFSTVRVYSTDCDTLETVGAAAKKHGLKIILGVFISSTGISGAKKQVWDIIGWAQWELVELIVVGNEAVFNGYCSASELAAFISESANFFKKAGYTGPVTTTEPLAEWLKDGSAFCSVVDVVAANLYAFFNAGVTADKAGDFIQRQIKELESVCPGKETYLMESGWPHAGKCNGVACPSPENQAIAIKSIEQVTGSKVIFFSFEDEAWKEPGEFGVEQYWGCASVF